MSSNMFKMLFTFSFLLISVFSFAQSSDKIVGLYRVIGDTSKEVSNVEITKTGNTFMAKISWLENPNDASVKPKVDKNNQEKSLRTRSLLGVTIIENIKYDGKNNKWVDGTIYDPASGKTYSVQVEFQDDSNLKVRGYKGSPAFGKTMVGKKLS